MNDTKSTWLRWIVGWATTAIHHTAAVAVYAFVLAYVITPSTLAWKSFRAAATIDELRDMSLTGGLIHVGLAACLWAMTYIVFSLVRLRRKQRKLQVVRARRGSVMTETIVILPVWMLLVFGLLQLAVNNVGGILANVAVYEAARSAWVWKGEAGKRANVNDAMVTDRARIAAALVMAPVAVGDFVANPILPTSATKMRNALALAHVPLSSAVAGALPAVAQDLLGAAGSLYDSALLATRENQSVWRALDGDLFIVRSLKKFTFAYHCTKVQVSETNGETQVKLTYKHQIAMPAMGPVFGKFNYIPTDTGLRFGYYTTYKRTSGRSSQSNNPANAALPSNFFSSSPPSGGGGEGELRGAVGFWD